MNQDTLANNKRIAKNTVFLYFRTIVILLVSLYTSRIVLNALGVEDYGIYNVVGGFVAMFSLLSGALSNAISRYITFELGRADRERLKVVFSTSVTVQIIISLIIIVIAEIIGTWFLNTQMSIPDGRITVANWVFQCSLLTFAINLISIPYNACIIAHEKMDAFAYVSILEASLKLGSVLLLFVIGFDRLLVYAVLMVFVALTIRLIYGIYCKRHFEECYYYFSLNRSLIKEMISLTGWNMLGSGGAILNSYGVNVLMNLFFGVKVNAARGLAVQVNSAVTQFVNGFTTAVNPQITKSYAQGNCDYTFRLVMMSSKYSFFLMLLFAIPLISETPYILELWLKNVPEYTILFVRLTLLISLITTLSTPLYTLALATGNIRKYQLVVGSLSLSCFFIVYIFYKIDYPVETAYFVSIFINVLILVARLIILSDLTGLSVRNYLSNVVFKALIVASLSGIIAFTWIKVFPESSFLHTLIVVFLCLVFTSIIILFIGLSSKERKYIYSNILRKRTAK